MNAIVKHIRWDELEWEQMNPRLERKFVSVGNLTLARFVLKKGVVVRTHSHENQQLSYILEGALKFSIEGKEIVVSGGELLCIPPDVPHSAEAMEDTTVIDVFSPARADWANRQDDYLRGKR